MNKRLAARLNLLESASGGGLRASKPPPYGAYTFRRNDSDKQEGPMFATFKEAVAFAHGYAAGRTRANVDIAPALERMRGGR